MRLIRGLYSCPPELFAQGCVATIGNFDGVHLGHQTIIERLTRKAKALNLPSVVILFEPHAQEFFRPQQAPARLFKLTDKVCALADLGVDYVLCLRFNQELAQLRAEDFVRRVLVERFRVKHLFIGDDFRFGHQRQGDFELLKSYDFVVEANQTVSQVINDQNLRISSSLVRRAIADNDFALAQQLLGKPYRVCGKVAHGDKQGRQIGVPTANIALKRRQSPLQGVYAVRVYGINADGLKDANWSAFGVANVGVKRTLKTSMPRLEVHIFDFDQDIYRQQICVEPVAKIREETKFDSVEALKKQIAHDMEQAKKIFEI